MQDRIRGENNMCFGCSQTNPIGLKLKFSLDGDICSTEFEAKEHHQGWNGFMHGGLIAALLDETMAWWLWFKDYSIMTVEMKTRYSFGVPINTKLKVESWCEEIKRDRIYVMAGRIVLPDGQVAVKSTAKFMRTKNM